MLLSSGFSKIMRRATCVALALIVLLSTSTVLTPSVRGQDFVSENFDLMESFPQVDYEQNFPMTGTGFLTSPAELVTISQAQAHSGSKSALFDAKYDLLSYVGAYNNGYLSFWFYLTNTSTIQPSYTLRVDSTLAASGYEFLSIVRTTDSDAHFVLKSMDWDDANETMRTIADVPTNTWHKLTFEINDTYESYREEPCYLWDVWFNDELVGFTPIQIDEVSMGYLETSALKLTINRGGTTGTGAPFYLDDFVISDTAPGPVEDPEPDASFEASPSSGIAPLEVTFTPTSVAMEAYAWNFGDGNTSTAIAPTHTYQLPGTYNVTLNVTSGGMYDESWEIVTVSPVPAITSTPGVTVLIGETYTYAPVCNVAVTGWTIQTNATFLSINSSTGVVSGEVTIEDVGWHGIIITADTSPVCTQEYILWVSAPPPEPGTITSLPVTRGSVNESYRYQVACSVAVTSWSVSGADFLTISSSGLITGTPGADNDGSHAVVVAAVTDGGTVWQNYTLEVRGTAVIDGALVDDTVPIVVGALVVVLLLGTLGGLFAKATSSLGLWRRRQ